MAVSTVAGMGWTNTSPQGDADGRGAVERRDVSAFLDQWRASRQATWVVESEFTRRTEAGGRLAFTIHNAQRPPDRLLFGFGTVVARRGDMVLACAGGGRGPASLRCRESAAAAPWRDEVDAELAILASYFTSPEPLYAVTAYGRGCFRLSLLRSILSAPYGTSARFCFDPATKAPVLAEVVRPEGTDVTRAVDVGVKVTEADLAPPPELAT